MTYQSSHPVHCVSCILYIKISISGCGKTTQIVQYVLDEYILNKQGSLCNIMCTQPRRIAAITVAERVASERNEELRDCVGYQIRLEK